MSIITTIEENVFVVTQRDKKPPKFPRDDKGRAVPRACPQCDCGVLQYEGEGFWRCGGLADPNNTEKELEACTFTHEDGKPYDHPS